MREPHEVLQMDQRRSLRSGKTTAQADDLRRGGADDGGEVDASHSLQYLRVDLPRGSVFGERRRARQKLVDEDSQRPNVRSEVVTCEMDKDNECK